MTAVDGFTEALRWVVWLGLLLSVVVMLVVSLRRPRRRHYPRIGGVSYRPCDKCENRP